MSLFTLSDSPSVTFAPLNALFSNNSMSTFDDWLTQIDGVDHAFITDFREVLDDLLPDWRSHTSALRQSINSISQPIKWPLLAFEKGDTLNLYSNAYTTSTLTWRLEGESVLLVTRAQLPEQLAAVNGMHGGENHLSYQFTAEGMVSAGVQGVLNSLTSLNLAAAVAVNASGSQQITAYCNHPSDTIFYDALLRDGALLGNLLSLEGFKDNLISALVIKRKGELSFSSEVGVQIGLAQNDRVGNQVTADLPKASIQMEHAWSLSGEFDALLYRPQGYQGVRLRLLKSRRSSASTNWTFNADVKFTGLAQQVGKALIQLATYPTQVSQWLEKVTLLSDQLDDVLVEQLQKLPEEAQGLLPKLTGAEAIDIESVVATLKGCLEDPYSQLTQWQTDITQQKVAFAEIMTALFGDEVPERAVEWVNGLLAAVEQQGLGTAQMLLDNLVADLGDTITENLLEPLALVDNRFESMFDEFDTATAAFSAPFMQLLQEFQQSLQVLKGTVQQTMTDELQLVYSLSESRVSEHDAIIDVSFPFYDIETEQGQRASALLASCLSGNFQPLLACHHSGDEQLKSLFKLENSVFNNAFISRQESHLLLNVFGWKIGRRKLFEQVTKLQYSGDGVMSTAQTQAQTEFQSGAFCLRVNSFANLMAMRDSNLVVSLRYDDDLFEQGELNRLLEQLQTQYLISAERGAAIRQVLLDEAYLGEQKQCAIQISLSIMPQLLERALTAEKMQQRAQEVALQAVGTSWERYMMNYQQLRYKRSIAVIKAFKPSHSLAKNILALGVMSYSARKLALAKISRRLGDASSHSGAMHSRVNPPAKFVNYAFSISQDFVKLIEAFKTAHLANARLSEAGTPNYTVDEIKEMLLSVRSKFEGCFDDWVEGFGYLGSIDAQQIHPGQLALFIALMAFAEVPETALNVKLILNDKDKPARFINC